MSTNTDLVRDALSDEPKTREELAEATGLELSQLSPILSALRKSGEAASAGQCRWIAGDGSAKANESPSLARLATMAEKGEKPTRKARKAPAVPHIVAPPDRVEFARFGEYVVLRRADLRLLLATLERFRPLLEAA